MDSTKEFLMFTSATANVKNFLGSIDMSQHFRTYQSIVQVESDSHRDLLDFAVEDLTVQDEYDAFNLEKPMKPLYITFHSGSYNMLIAHLLSNGHKIQVLSDNRSSTLSDYLEAPISYRERYQNSCDCNMLNVEEKGFIFRAIGKIKEGYPLVAFIDGNKGIDGLTRDNENLAEIKFANGVVRVRKGLPYLSYLMSVPIVLVLSYKQGGKNYLRTYPPLVKNDSESKDDYTQRCLEQIFGWFEGHVRNHLDQWSGWLYVHYWSDLSKFQFGNNDKNYRGSSEGIPAFNSERFLPIKFQNEFLLFDLREYSAIKIDVSDVQIFSNRTDADYRKVLIQELMATQSEKIEYFLSREVLVN